MCNCQTSDPISLLESIADQATSRFLAAVTGAQEKRDKALRDAGKQKLATLRSAYPTDQDQLKAITQRAIESYNQSAKAARLEYADFVQSADDAAMEEFSAVRTFFALIRVERELARRQADA